MAESASQSQNTPGSHSPIGQLLSKLGMTREDLSRHSVQMREFLTAETENSLRAIGLIQDSPHSRQDTQPPQRFVPIAPAPAQSHSGTSVASVAQTPNSRTSTLPPAAPYFGLQTDENHASHRPSKQRDERDKIRTSRRCKETRGRGALPSSSPARPKPSLDEIMQMRSRDSRRVPESDDSEDSEEESDVFKSRPMPSMATPESRKETDWNKSSPSRRTSVSSGSSRLATQRRRDSPNNTPSSSYYKPIAYAEQLPVTPQGPSHRHPQKTQQSASRIRSATPSKSASAKHYRKDYDAIQPFLPPSSPPLPSSPISSPINRGHKFVSSPGPIDSDPPDQTDPDLPFKLPAGPYSDAKPDLSYAALIGRAILASPSHSLRLKDIYDYITIVFPHFERHGHSHSQKWMNAIRQNLTNTPQFQKVERGTGGEASRGSFWHITEEDAPCFANGGYNRHATDANPHASSAPRADKRKRKQAEEQLGQQPKKAKLVPIHSHAHAHVPNPHHFPYAGSTQPPTGYMIHGHPYYYAVPMDPRQTDVLFPPLPPYHPSAHLTRPTYEPADAVFPPLPASRSRYLTQAELVASQNSQSKSPSTDVDPSPTPPPASSASSSFSMPELTPNQSSSSPPMPEDELLADLESDVEGVVSSAVVDDEIMCLGSRNSVGMADALEPGIELMDRIINKDKRQQTKSLIFPPPLPLSTVPNTRARGAKATRQPRASAHAEELRSSTPPARPSTPPQTQPATTLQLSPARTPISRKGLQMSPFRSLAYSKSSSEYHSHEERDFNEDVEDLDAHNRTPSRRRTTSATVSTTALPSTPKRHVPPFATISPFRTPSRRMVFDPHDPSALLDDELTRLGSLEQSNGLQESPVGFFGHGKGLLYESPSLPSPGQWRRPW